MPNPYELKFDLLKHQMLEQRVVIIGNGQLGSALFKQINNSILFSRENIDLSKIEEIKLNLHRLLLGKKIWCIINATAYNNVENAPNERELCDRINHLAVKELATFCKDMGILFVHFSTDFVFDGESKYPYQEKHQANPINYYGESKLSGEIAITDLNLSSYFIFRVSWLYSAFHKNNFVYKIITQLKNGRNIEVVEDQVSSPCNTFILAKIIKTLLEKIAMERRSNQNINYGLYHISDDSYISRYQMANIIFEHMVSMDIIKKYNVELIPIQSSQIMSVVARPKNSRLDGTLFQSTFNLSIGDALYHLSNGINVMLSRISNGLLV